MGPLVQNPYVLSSAGPEETRPIARLGATVLTWSLAVGVAYGVAAGMAMCARSDFGLTRFGGVGYTPRVIALGAVRGWGVWGAALVPAMTTVVLLHRAGRQGARLTADARLSLAVALAVLGLYPIVVTLGWLGALPVWCADSGGSAHAFADGIRDGLLLADVGHGFVASAVNAIVLAVGVRAIWERLLSQRWKLFPKLFVVWAGLQGVAFANDAWGTWL